MSPAAAPARLPTTERRPADATIFAIVDTWDVDGKMQYKKQVTA